MLNRKSLNKDLDSWFRFDTQQQMIAIFQVIDEAPKGSYRNAATLPWSKTLHFVDGFTSVVPSITLLQLQFFLKAGLYHWLSEMIPG